MIKNPHANFEASYLALAWSLLKTMAAPTRWDSPTSFGVSQ